MNWSGELRYALRVLARHRGYTAVAALTLALSIGANTAIFSMADAVVNRPYPFPRLNRIVALSSTIPKIGAERYRVSAADFFDWREQNRVFQQVAAYRPWSARLVGSHESVDVRAAQVSSEFFALIGVVPLRGRVFASHFGEDERHNVVVSHGFWQRQMAADSLNLNGIRYTVIGVMPQSFDFPSSVDVWVPWMITPEQARAERANDTLNVIARLRDGVSLAQARQDSTRIARELANRYPATNTGRDTDVMLLSQSADPYAVRYTQVLGAAVLFLLVLACANVANLQLARCSARRREMAIRAALGGHRWQIARQLLMEGVVLSCLGAALGLPLAFAGLELIRGSMPAIVVRHLPGLPYAAIDGPVLAWLSLAAVVTGILFTLPAVLQIAPGQAIEALKEEGRGTVGSGGGVRSALVVCEIAFALVLVVGASLLVRSFRGLSTLNQGFDPSGVLTFTLRNDTSTPRFYQEALRRLNQLPEVKSAALISELPALAGSVPTTVAIEGQPAPPPDRPLLAELRIASEEYFRCLSVRLVSGRAFEDRDNERGLPVAIVSQAAARRFWPQGRALGQRLRIGDGEWLTVVGIAGDVNHFFLDSEIRPQVYVPFQQSPARAMAVIVKPAASTAIAQTTAAVREAMRTLDRAQPAYNLGSLSQLFTELAGGVGVLATLFAVFAACSLTFSAAGVYAVMHHSVTRRIPEIGVRMALGAQATEVRNLVLGDALRLVGVAFAGGLPAAWWLNRVMSSVLAGIVPVDVTTLSISAMLVAGSAVLAAWLPARRATRVDPLAAMRRG